MKRTVLPWVLAAFLLACLIAAFPLGTAIRELKRQIRYEHEYMYAVWNMRNVALKGTKEQAAQVLFELQDEPFRKYTPVALEKGMDGLVKEARYHATLDIIEHLRAETKEDLGDKPDHWIMRFGEAAYKNAQKELNARKESK